MLNIHIWLYKSKSPESTNVWYNWFFSSWGRTPTPPSHRSWGTLELNMWGFVTKMFSSFVNNCIKASRQNQPLYEIIENSLRGGGPPHPLPQELGNIGIKCVGESQPKFSHVLWILLNLGELKKMHFWRPTWSSTLELYFGGLMAKISYFLENVTHFWGSLRNCLFAPLPCLHFCEWG